MQVIEVKRNVPFIPTPNEVRITLADQLPPLELITTAFGLLFDGNRLLATQLISRGWDIPGGHREPGESPIETAKREVLEETGVEAEGLKLLGYEKFVIHAPMPEDFPYPYPASYQVFYCGRVGRLHQFSPTAETYGRGLFGPDEARKLKWVASHRGLYKAALRTVEGL